MVLNERYLGRSFPMSQRQVCINTQSFGGIVFTSFAGTDAPFNAGRILTSWSQITAPSDPIFCDRFGTQRFSLVMRGFETPERT